MTIRVHRCVAASALLWLAAAPAAAAWLVVSVADFGAVGDNATDCTRAFRAALAAVAAVGGGEVVVPAGGLFKTGPVNLTSNVRLTVNGEMWALETTNTSVWPKVPVVPTYATTFPATRWQPFVFAPPPATGRSSNISIAGVGEINGAGPFWWCSPDGVGQCPNYDEQRPHLVSLTEVVGVEITGVTLRNSAFWTLRPVFCASVWIHDMQIITPWCGGDEKGGPGGPNTDGIDVDSSEDVVIERCFISVGDDHVTVLAGAEGPGRDAARPSRNVTVRDNRLGTGMGMSIGSSVSGGVEDVLYTRNVQQERPQDWGMGMHIKTRVSYGGYIRNIAYVDNVFTYTTNGLIYLETDYQSSGGCNATTCTEIRDIVFRNNSGNARSVGSLTCMPSRPCVNISFEDLVFNATNTEWGCKNVSSGFVRNVTPPGLAEACGFV
jgi:polygalacturonase